MLSHKVSKEELQELMPDQSLMDEKVRTLVEEGIDALQEKLADKFQVWDQRLLSIRTEFDMTSLRKLLDTKATKAQVENDFSNHEFKISTLDKNIVAIAQDFETFQTAINKMHAVLIDLQEANKDVLVGKRNVNCLSCGFKDNNLMNTITGKDGHVYRGNHVNTLEFTNDGGSTT